MHMPLNNEENMSNVPLATTAYHVHRLLMDETASKYESSCNCIKKTVVGSRQVLILQLRFGLRTTQLTINVAYYRMLQDLGYWRDFVKMLMKFPVP
jgi:hypothetical protein